MNIPENIPSFEPPEFERTAHNFIAQIRQRVLPEYSDLSINLKDVAQSLLNQTPLLDDLLPEQRELLQQALDKVDQISAQMSIISVSIAGNNLSRIDNATADVNGLAEEFHVQPDQGITSYKSLLTPSYEWLRDLSYRFEDKENPE